MAFFIGDLDGNGSHDELAEKIASAGKQWTADYWRWEDMQACTFDGYPKLPFLADRSLPPTDFFRLLLEVSRSLRRVSIVLAHNPLHYSTHE